MSAENKTVSILASWASAFVDGEASLPAASDWSEAVHEQLFYYTITRQVLRGEATGAGRCDHFQTQRATWVQFWARVDAV